jgi:hypothetical protein
MKQLELALKNQLRKGALLGQTERYAPIFLITRDATTPHL